MRERGVLLGDLGDVLHGQGRYPQAQEMFEEALKVDEQLDDVRGQAANLAQLGTLNLVQQNFAEAKKCYKEALDFFRGKSLNEPEMEATAQHQLGMVAEKQKEWDEAEQHYRRSLEIKEFIGHTKSAASTCNQLANLAEKVGHPREAERWYRRALKLLEPEEQGRSSTGGGPEQATIFNNLADLLVNEVQSGRSAKERLIEARNYAEQALAIREKLDASENLWDTLHLIGEIEVLEGRAEQARDYRRRERESFAAFTGNRYHIYQDHKRLIAAVVAAAKGSELELAMVEKVLPSLEEKGWHVTSAIQRIWVGERDWYALTEDLDAQSALLVKLMLETLAQSTEAQDGIPEQEMPLAIHQVFEQGAATPFERAFADLSREELLRYRQALKEK
jgi:tetratricopeptide (TPR) repeat protein